MNKYFTQLLLGFTILFGVDYQTQIQPIFSQYCTGCHPNAGGLSLTTYDNVMDGGNSGMVIAVYNHSESDLWQRINSGIMPPGGNDLSQAQVNLIGQWINEGALPYEVNETDLDYDSEIEPIFQTSCSSGYCHGGDAGGLTLLTYDELMEGGSHGEVVIPGNGSGSNLIKKLSAAPPFGNQMPSGMAPLSPLIIHKIYTWINEGANPSGPSEIEIVIDHNQNWNLVGLPLIVENPSQLSVYPESIENTLYEFNLGYEQAQEFEIGRGYWIRFAEASSSTVSGFPIESVTIQLNEGWNLIAGTSFPSPPIYDPNEILVEGTLYEFNNGYVQASFLEPGAGYWVRASESGEVILGVSFNSFPENDAFIFKIEDSNLKNKLFFNDIPIYFGSVNIESELMKYSLPPKPPFGAYDVRFADDMRLSQNGGQIEIQSSEELITVKSELKTFINWTLINDKTGETYSLQDNHTFVISSVDVLQLVKIQDEPMPYHFSLHQNFPNPFNPSTIIKFDIAREGPVSLFIYDTQGQLTKKLIEEKYKAGQYSVEWDGKNLFGSPVPSGVYIYKLKTVHNSVSKKMTLLR